jgi:polysaccharide pyruvyl transferase WcaK-like protein
MKLFVRWLVDSGRKVRLFVGDTNNSELNVVPEILTDLRVHRPDLDPAWVVAEPVSSFSDVMHAMAPAGIVVATRFHNMICALLLCKPTISLGYAPKFTAVMSDMELAEFCQYTHALNLERLIEQFKDLDKRQAELRQSIMECNRTNARLVEDQFAELSAVLFSRDALASAKAEH